MKLFVLVPQIPSNPESALAGSLLLLKSAADKLSCDLEVIESLHCRMLFNGVPDMRIDGCARRIKTLLVKPSFPLSKADIHASLIRQFELTGTRTINSYTAIMDAKNKIRMTQKLCAAHIPIPKTLAVRSSDHLRGLTADVGRFPVIIKNATGSGGIGVAIVESKRALKSIIEMLMDGDDATPLIVQEYIREAASKDVRVFVVGGKIIAAMLRISSAKGEFRSNFSIGGKVQVAELTSGERRLALRAARAMELDFAGVDIIRSASGPRVLEVNANPGLVGITQATGLDVAGALLRYVLDVHTKL